MSKSIRLHPTKGLNPRLTCCAWCGKDLGVALLGANDSVPEGTKIADGLCDECEAKRLEHEGIVEAGGVYWRCADCKSEGVVKAESGLSAAVREAHGLAEPGDDGKFEKCGIEFVNGDDGMCCPACNPEESE